MGLGERRRRKRRKGGSTMPGETPCLRRVEDREAESPCEEAGRAQPKRAAQTESRAAKVKSLVTNNSGLLAELDKPCRG